MWIKRESFPAPRRISQPAGRSPTWSCAAAKADFRGQRLERPAWQGELDSTETFPHHQRLWITYKSIILGCAMQIGIVLARSEDLP
jgi:hypothetical protein